jgi:hypothetical protein
LKGCELCKAFVVKGELVLRFQALGCHHRYFLYKVLLFLTCELQALITTPLPAALPLFAAGLGAMGLFGWRRKRKLRARAS